MHPSRLGGSGARERGRIENRSKSLASPAARPERAFRRLPERGARAIAREPEFGYSVMVGDTYQYTAENREFQEGKSEKVVVVDDSYLDRHAPIARERIAMAGVRLRGLLSQALMMRVLSAELLGRALVHDLLITNVQVDGLDPS